MSAVVERRTSGPGARSSPRTPGRTQHQSDIRQVALSDRGHLSSLVDCAWRSRLVIALRRGAPAPSRGLPHTTRYAGGADSLLAALLNFSVSRPRARGAYRMPKANADGVADLNHNCGGVVIGVGQFPMGKGSAPTHRKSFVYRSPPFPWDRAVRAEHRARAT